MPKSSILPEGFVLNNRNDVKPYYDMVFAEEINSVDDLKKFIANLADLDEYVNEDYAWRYIRQTCNTLDEDIKKHYEAFVDNIQPERTRVGDRANRVIVDSEFAAQLDGAYLILLRGMKRLIELFREENIPLQQEVEKLCSEYNEIISKMTIVYQGEELTLKQAEKLLKDADREIRKEVWEKSIERRTQDAQSMHIILDKLIALRHQIAKNCGFDNYTEFRHYALNRFDYTIDDVNDFHQSIKEIIMPLCKTIHEHRERVLGFALKPYDFDVSLYEKTSHECYKDSNDLVEKVSKALDRTYSEFGDLIRKMSTLGQLDLDTRKGKAPGGYNFPLTTGDTSFIFMNASNDSYGLFTMIHECGHALHHYYTDGIIPSSQRYPGSEVCEIASMAQELLSLDKLQDFFETVKDYDIAILEKIEDDLLTFPWISKVDLYQQWLYRNPNHTHQDREDKRIELTKEYEYDSRTGTCDSWLGEYEHYLGINRQKQSHIFTSPFYYIEYGIASLGAIAIRKNYLSDNKNGVLNYINLLKVGDTKTMPEIFDAGGIKFDFSASYIQGLMNFMQDRLRMQYQVLG